MQTKQRPAQLYRHTLSHVPAIVFSATCHEACFCCHLDGRPFFVEQLVKNKNHITLVNGIKLKHRFGTRYPPFPLLVRNDWIRVNHVSQGRPMVSHHMYPCHPIDSYHLAICPRFELSTTILWMLVQEIIIIRLSYSQLLSGSCVKHLLFFFPFSFLWRDVLWGTCLYSVHNIHLHACKEIPQAFL
jgi:hypothetical protein